MGSILICLMFATSPRQGRPFSGLTTRFSMILHGMSQPL